MTKRQYEKKLAKALGIQSRSVLVGFPTPLWVQVFLERHGRSEFGGGK